MANKNYMEELIAHGRAKHGEKFDASELDERFARYWFSKERIKVKDNWEGDIMYGAVGMTTGHRPAFLLMKNSRCIGSDVILNKDYEILGVQQKGYKKYSNPY